MPVGREGAEIRGGCGGGCCCCGSSGGCATTGCSGRGGSVLGCFAGGWPPRRAANPSLPAAVALRADGRPTCVHIGGMCWLSSCDACCGPCCVQYGGGWLCDGAGCLWDCACCWGGACCDASRAAAACAGCGSLCISGGAACCCRLVDCGCTGAALSTSMSSCRSSSCRPATYESVCCCDAGSCCCCAASSGSAACWCAAPWPPCCRSCGGGARASGRATSSISSESESSARTPADCRLSICAGVSRWHCRCCCCCGSISSGERGAGRGMAGGPSSTSSSSSANSSSMLFMPFKKCHMLLVWILSAG